MSYYRAYDNSTSLLNSTNLLNFTNTYDTSLITGIGNIRTNLMVEEVESLKRVVKELSQSIDSIHEKIEKNQPGEGYDHDEDRDENETKDKDNKDKDNKDKDNKDKDNKDKDNKDKDNKDKDNKENKDKEKNKKTWKTVLSGIKNRTFYYGIAGASICALYLSRKLLQSFTSSPKY